MPKTQLGVPLRRFTLPVAPPYRLDLTAAVLRRLSTNPVDVVGPDGVYRRALPGAAGPTVVAVAQHERDALCVETEGTLGRKAVTGVLRRMLGLDVELRRFARISKGIPWLGALAARMRGVRPPRYPTLWEACVNAIVFQQISLFAAGAMMRRLVEAFGARARAKAPLFAFPEPAAIAAAGQAELRSAGLSAAKSSALRGIAEHIVCGRLDESDLERRSSAAAAATLMACKGIGPWTAALVLLRGLGRLDVFPQNDSGAARSVALLAGGKPLDIAPTLQRLGDQRGMLYYHLLLARLEARGDLPPAPQWR